jgi:predicted metal-dependent peptidase
MLRKGWTPKPKPGGGGGGGGGGDVGKKGPPDHGCGEVLVPKNCKGDSQEAKDAIDKEAQNINNRVAEAAMLERQIGGGKGGMIDKIFTSTGKTASSDHIRYFLKKHFSYVRSYKRPNRRFLHRKIYLPSKIKTPHTLISCIDSSASMGRDDFEKCRGSLVRFSKELGLSLIRVAYVDTVIHMNPKTNEPWYDIDLKNGTGADAMELNIYGGGGTSFDPIFDYIDKNNEDVGGLVYFTDGYGSVRDRNPSFPVLWITTAKAPSVHGHQGRETKLFGKVVHI